MLQILRFLLSFSIVILFTLSGFAQQRSPQKINNAALQTISQEQTKKYMAAQSKIKELAKKNKWIISETKADGISLVLQGISESGRPLYYSTQNNSTAAKTTSTDQVWSGGSAGLSLNGSSALLKGKLGIWDGGAVRGTHQELIGRIINRDGYKTLDNHATHVAGTMISRGLSPAAKGMAHQAASLQSWYFDNDAAEMAAAANSLLISNHSYGYIAGWQYMGNKWYWLGDTRVSETEDVYFGFYDYAAQVWDNIAYNSPYYLMVKAAGNSRNMKEPAVGTPYYKLNSTTNTWQLVEKRSAEMRSYTGYDLIPDHSVAKNILTIGAMQGLSNGYNQASEVISANFSCWGPTDDGRIKPDLVGNGISVTSTNAGSDNAYASSSGTSMASPNVSGSLYLLQEHYANLHQGAFMRAATLKGLAIHTAHEAGLNPGPDYVFGWGLLNAAGAAKVISNAGKKNLIAENTLTPNGTYTQNIMAGNEPLRVTIAWTDPAGSILPMDTAALNNRTPRLVNDLDVRISSNNNTYYPWILDPANPAAAATTGDNIRDNVEQILIPNPVPGQTYTITISHKGTLKNNVQDYSLIVSGLQATPYCTSAPSTLNGARIENITMGGLNHATTDCTPYNDFTSLTANAEANQQLAIALTLGSCATETNKIAKIFADWNEDGDFDDADELALTTNVIFGNGTINGFIKVPATIIAGNTTRLRVVVVETNNAALVTACGNYGKGETEDYTLLLKQTSQDVAVSQIILPATDNFYASAAQGITVKLRNNGSADQTNIPISVSISNGQKIIATLNSIYKGILPASEETTFTISGSFKSLPATNYIITAAANLEQDQQPDNNAISATFATAAASPQPIATATNCGDNTSVTLKGTGSGTIFWYDASENGNLLATGNIANTNAIPANITYYAAVNNFYDTTATLQNDIIGNYANYARDTVYFNAGTAFILDKVSLNAGAAGTITVTLINPAKVVIASTQLQLVPGVSEYALNFLIPAAGNKYKLTVSSFVGGATANRNDGAGSVVYPYNIANLLSITGNSSGAATYFYLYNWKIKAAGSPSNLVAVKVNGEITASALKVCVGSNKGTISLTGFEGKVVHWQISHDNNSWSPINNTQQQLTFENLTATTFFRAILAVEGCTETIISNSVSIEVVPLPKPVITTSSGLTKLEAGSTLTLTASASTSYLWSTGDTTANITIAAPGSYTVTVKNETGCAATSAPITIVSDATFWTGAIDTDWFNAGNWNAGVPNDTTDAYIPAGKTSYPIILSDSASCKSLFINGNLTLESGTLAINSNFINNGNYIQQGGEITFSGTRNHEIAAGSFNNLVINSSGTTTLSSDITINGALTIKNGSINTGANKIILGKHASLVETETQFITGQVSTIRTLDQTNYTQNFGSMGIQITTHAAPGAIRVTRHTGVTANNLASSIKRVYDIDVLSGKDFGLDATMEFNYFAHELNNQHKNDLALYRSSDKGQTWIVQENSQAAPDAGMYKITLNHIDAFSSWTAADRYLNLNSPVTLVSFEAHKKQQNVLLTWETITKNSLAGIEVEVSYDNENYQTLGTVDPKEDALTIRQQYEFLDQEANKPGPRYYRLKQLTTDGQYIYHGPVLVNGPLAVNQEINAIAPQNNVLLAYPNPTTGTFKLISETEERGNMVIEIKNTAGQTVYTAQKFLVKGSNQTEISLSPNLKPGLYIVFTHQKNQYQQLKLILK